MSMEPHYYIFKMEKLAKAHIMFYQNYSIFRAVFSVLLLLESAIHLPKGILSSNLKKESIFALHTYTYMRTHTHIYRDQ